MPSTAVVNQLCDSNFSKPHQYLTIFIVFPGGLYLPSPRCTRSLMRTSSLSSVTVETRNSCQDFSSSNTCHLSFCHQIWFVDIRVTSQVVLYQLQSEAPTLPNATPQKGKIQPFSKIAVTFAPMMQFLYPLRLRMP